MPFRIHSDNNDKFSPYWINVERIIATARGHKQRSAAIAFPNIRLRLRVRSHSMSQDCNWVGKDMRWNRRPSCEPRTLTQLFRKQKEPLGSHESINLLPLSLTKTTLSGRLSTSISIRFHHPLSTFDRRRLPVLIWGADKPSCSVQIYPGTFTKTSRIKRILRYRADSLEAISWHVNPMAFLMSMKWISKTNDVECSIRTTSRIYPEPLE